MCNCCLSGWLASTGFDVGKEPLFLLGKCYSSLSKYSLSWWLVLREYWFSAGENHSVDNDSAPTHIKHFVDHFITITWLTYRKDFPPIEGTCITTDCGWGCMVRSGQMLLATALNYHLLGKGMDTLLTSCPGTNLIFPVCRMEIGNQW